MYTSITQRVGLAVLGLLSLADVVEPLVTDGKTPPMGIALVDSALGVVSLIALVLAVRGSRRGLLTVVGLRLLSALTTVPAFFVSAVPTPVVAISAALVALTIAAVVAVLRPAHTVVVAS